MTEDSSNTNDNIQYLNNNISNNSNNFKNNVFNLLILEQNERNLRNYSKSLDYCIQIVSHFFFITNTVEFLFRNKGF